MTFAQVPETTPVIITVIARHPNMLYVSALLDKAGTVLNGEDSRSTQHRPNTRVLQPVMQ